jgi:hypothetical protein
MIPGKMVLPRRRHGPGKWRKKCDRRHADFRWIGRAHAAVAMEVVVSDWIEVTQRRINRFA